MFSKDHNVGSVVYLSSGFVEQNQKLFNDNQYGIFSFGNPSGTEQYTEYNIGSVTQGYD